MHDTLTRSKFLQAVWLNGSVSYFWVVPGKRSHWVEIDKQPFDIRGTDGLNVYYGVNPCNTIPVGKEPKSTRAQLGYVQCCNVLFADFDAKDFGHSKRKAMAHIKTLAIAPSVIVDSGNGYHTYHLLQDTFVVDTAAKRAYIASIQRQWVAILGADKEVCDLTRVLRLPGTSNHKTSKPRQVKFVHTDFDRRVSLDQLAALLPVQSQEAEQPLGTTAQRSGGGDSIIARYNQLVRIESILLANGYSWRGERFLPPNSSTGCAGVTIGDTIGDDEHTNMCYSHNGDPLAGGFWRDPFHARCILEFNGDFKHCLRVVAAELATGSITS